MALLHEHGLNDCRRLAQVPGADERLKALKDFLIGRKVEFISRRRGTRFKCLCLDLRLLLGHVLDSS